MKKATRDLKKILCELNYRFWKKKCLKNTLWRYFNWFSIWFQVVWEIFYLVWEVHPSRRVEEVDRTRTEEMIGGVGAVWGVSIKKIWNWKGKSYDGRSAILLLLGTHRRTNWSVEVASLAFTANWLIQKKNIPLLLYYWIKIYLFCYWHKENTF